MTRCLFLYPSTACDFIPHPLGSHPQMAFSFPVLGLFCVHVVVVTWVTTTIPAVCSSCTFQKETPGLITTQAFLCVCVCVSVRENGGRLRVCATEIALAFAMNTKCLTITRSVDRKGDDYAGVVKGSTCQWRGGIVYKTKSCGLCCLN